MKHKSLHLLKDAGFVTILVSTVIAFSLTTTGFALPRERAPISQKDGEMGLQIKPLPISRDEQSTASAVSGFIRDTNGPIAGATVRVKATDKKPVTD